MNALFIWRSYSEVQGRQVGQAMRLSLAGAKHMNLSAMSTDALIALVQQMQKQNTRKLTLKVSAKGAVSLYGMGRFPVTLYAAQWDKVLVEGDAIREFIKTNESLLSSGKDDPKFSNAAE